MQNSGSAKRSPYPFIPRKWVHPSDMKLEKFKKKVFDIIEYKDKIIKMLCAILEVEGITNLNIKDFINGAIISAKEQLSDNNDKEFNIYKRKTPTKKRTFMDLYESSIINKHNEINIISDITNKNETTIKEEKLMDYGLCSHTSTNKKCIEQKINEHLLSDCSNNTEKSKIVDNNPINSKQKNEDDSIIEDSTKTNLTNSNHIDLWKNKKDIKKIKKSKNNFEENFNSDSHNEISQPSKKTLKTTESVEENCQLCLMPITESLHGGFPPILYTLCCNHVFHLMCLYETIIRRECRKTCCICHIELNDEDKTTIINKVKVEKKENGRRTKLLLKVMQLQAKKK